MKEVRRGAEAEVPLLTTGPEMVSRICRLQEEISSNARAASLLSPCFLLQTLPEFDGPPQLAGTG